MENSSKTIIVAWDFSPVAEYALEHAVIFAKNIGAKIKLAHIVKGASQKEDAENKILNDIEKWQKKYNINIGEIVRVGSIFTTIKEIAEEEDAQLVLMGTHGIKGMQKITGSWALKVIVGSTIPFLVVQKPPVKEKYTSIVFPVNFKKENKEKLFWAEFLDRIFKAKIRIITPKVPDGVMLQKTKANLVFTQKYLEQRGIDYDINTAKGERDFADETIEFAENEKADIILIMTTKHISIQDYMLGAQEQKIISNEANIPVMCVNPRIDLIKYGSFN